MVYLKTLQMDNGCSEEELEQHIQDCKEDWNAYCKYNDSFKRRPWHPPHQEQLRKFARERRIQELASDLECSVEELEHHIQECQEDWKVYCKTDS